MALLCDWAQCQADSVQALTILMRGLPTNACRFNYFQDNEARRKRQKREAKKQAKKKREDEEQIEFEDPEMAAMMGFGGFGGGNKK